MLDAHLEAKTDAISCLLTASNNRARYFSGVSSSTIGLGMATGALFTVVVPAPNSETAVVVVCPSTLVEFFRLIAGRLLPGKLVLVPASVGEDGGKKCCESLRMSGAPAPVLVVSGAICVDARFRDLNVDEFGGGGGPSCLAVGAGCTGRVWLACCLELKLDAPEGVRVIGTDTSPPFVGVDGVVVKSLLLALALALALGTRKSGALPLAPTSLRRDIVRLLSPDGRDLSIGNVAEAGKDDTAPKVDCSPS